MSPIEIMLVCLSVIACLSKIRKYLSQMWVDSHLSGTSHTVLLSSTLWNPDFIALAAVSRRQVEFSPTAPTRPTKYNCWPQLTARTHRTPRLEKATRPHDGSQAWLLGTKQGPLGSPTSSQVFSFIYHNQSKLGLAMTGGRVGCRFSRKPCCQLCWSSCIFPQHIWRKQINLHLLLTPPWYKQTSR